MLTASRKLQTSFLVLTDARKMELAATIFAASKGRHTRKTPPAKTWPAPRLARPPRCPCKSAQRRNSDAASAQSVPATPHSLRKSPSDTIKSPMTHPSTGSDGHLACLLRQAHAPARASDKELSPALHHPASKLSRLYRCSHRVVPSEHQRVRLVARPKHLTDRH